jgi:glutamate synthase domain-containing protein 1
MRVNIGITGSYIISSGRNMGIFKGVGFPEDIGNFFKLEKYKGHIWTSHGRFPTNSVGWWGGAHPFGLLDWSVVHNGEISSYGANKRFVSGFGYECTLSTDTEVIAYLFDLIARKQKVDLEYIHLILASPLWDEIERMPEDIREMARTLRIMYGSALVNGPFSIIVGASDFMYALNDRIKLRPMVAARKGNRLYVSSEEAPIKLVCPSPESVWRPSGGEPVIGRLKTKTGKKDKTAKTTA